MQWLERMNRAIDFIESNLTGEIELKDVASSAACSSYQFQRMFSFITDVTLGEYIRRRRLTLAALELQQDATIKVIDIALKYGYESPVSFARAFHAMHGINPTMCRRDGVTLKAYPRMSFLITVRGVEAMNYRLETKESFEIFGIERIFNIDGSGEVPQTPAAFWEQSHSNGAVKHLETCAGALPPFVYQQMHPVNALCSYRKTDPDTFPYMLCAFKGDDCNTKGYTTVQIPAYTWVIFPSDPHPWEEFGKTIEQLYKRFYTEWLPNSGYEQVDGIEFEMTGVKDELNYVELWFAVRKA